MGDYGKMAKLKCWKKVGNLNPPSWTNNRGIDIDVEYDPSNKEWDVTIFQFGHNRNIIKKKNTYSFKTKSKAIKSAKTFMKKNNRCKI